MKRFCLGFFFSPDLKRVLLIRKRRPQWQMGLLNGIGGHVEPGEEGYNAMVREMREETGLYVADWDPVAIFEDRDNSYRMDVFCAVGDISQAVSLTDEQVVRATTSPLPTDVIPNLRWLIPMCLDRKVSKPVCIGVA